MPKNYESTEFQKPSDNNTKGPNTNSSALPSNAAPQMKKKIFKQKVLFHQQEKHDISTTRIVKKLESNEDLAAYTKNQSCKMNKIKKRTVMIVGLDKYLVKNAVEALIVNHKAQLEQEIVKLKYDDYIFIDIILTEKLPKVTTKPILVKLQNRIFYKELKSQVCVIIKDKKSLRDDKTEEIFAGFGINILTYEDFNTKIASGGATKVVEFIRKHCLILSEDKIFESLRKRNYREFIKKRILPYPIKLKKVNNGELSKKLEEVLSSVCLVKMIGPSHAFKVGRCSISVKDNVKNIINGVYDVIPHLLLDSAKGTNVRSIKLRTNNSIQIPLYENKGLNNE